MANTVTVGASGVLTIVPDGATDFDIRDYFPNGIYLRSIEFSQSDNLDILYIRDKKVAGVFLTPEGLTGGQSLVEILPKRRFPYIKAADCTFTTPASCLITLYFD